MQFSNINYNLYKSFLVVYETSNISKAAELLYISQPAVSHNIKELEKQLGVQLFYKRANGMSSTTEADTLYRYISSAFNSIWKGEMTISDMAGLKTGVVKIGTQSYLSVLFLSNIITEFRQKFPNIKIEINCKASTELLAGLQTQNIDVVIENQPINIEKNNIEVKYLKSYSHCFVTTDKYFVNSEGKLLFGKKYRRVYPFSENLACVFTKGYDYVVIDRNGESLTQLPPGFDLEQDWYSIHNWENDFSWYQQNFITGVHDGLLAVSRSETDKMGYINMMGELVISCQYDNAEPFSNGLAAVESDNQWFYINKRGDVVFRHPKSLFKKCRIFKNGVAVGEFEENVLDSVSKISYTHAIYDTSGKILLKGTRTLHNIVQYYDNCFKYKLYPVQGICSDGSYIFGYINSNFELVIPYQFSFVEPFKDEFTSVTGEKGCGLLDSYGNVVWLDEEESENVLEER